MFDIAAIGRGLPFAAATEGLVAAAREHGVAVVEAPPGTGKTTLAPPTIAGCVEGRVVVTQPRRVAVRAAARRLASLTGTPIGELVGFTVRGERVVRPTARIEMVTPGVLLRRLLADPTLDGVGAVLLDEVHERGIDTDLLVGLLNEVREIRSDLVLVAMSATADSAGLATLLGAEGAAAPIVGVAAESYPLEERWAPPSAVPLDARGVTPDFLEHVAEVTRRAVAEHPSAGDVLVFLPGVREVRRVAEALSGRVDADVLQLHGQIGAREQDRAVGARRPDDPRRIVVSTSLAESSLTVDGVRIVVDAGLSREPRRDAARGMSGLVTVRCARSSADQRAGRAARQAAGVVWRCYDESTYAAMRAQVTPEVATADLTAALLTLAAWGSPRGVGLALPSPLPAGAVRDGEIVLRSLDAIDDDGRLTVHGRRLAELPVGPRWARAVLDGAELVGARAAAEVVACIELDLARTQPDVLKAITTLRNGSGPDTTRWRREVGRLERLVGGPFDEARSRRAEATSSSSAVAQSARAAAHPTAVQPAPDPASATRSTATRPTPTRPMVAGSGGTAASRFGAGIVVALAYPDRIARRVGATHLFASGTRAAAPLELAGHEWLAVADVSRAVGSVARGTGAIIRTAAPIDEDSALLAGRSLVVEEIRGALADRRLTARQVRALGAIELSSTPVPASELGPAAVENAVRNQGLEVIGWSPSADQLRRRLALVRRHLGDPWPDMSEDALLARLEEWLAPELEKAAATGRLGAIDLSAPLRRMLPWPAAARFDELAPERLTVPSGSGITLDYPAWDSDGPVVCAVRLQEIFGLTESPRLVDGRVRVQFHLLSPARRPVAITDDLASFWAGPYAQVRAEMRGRYPKHSWPENPLEAQPLRGVRRR